MNLWFWPFLAASPGLGWSHTASLAENFQGYLAYYLATSVVWDVTRAIGNLIIFMVMARPVIKIFTRFIQRFTFKYQEVILR
jgi:energy-coupling factor transport system substrate-specific component